MKALVVYGGWDGHQPKEVAAIYSEFLEKNGFTVTVSDTLDAYATEDLTTYRLIVPIWTMGTITPEQLNPLLAAVKGGVGIAGCHGGMCDSFRMETEYQFMTGGQWVSHPGDSGVHYTVDIRVPDHFITSGSPNMFTVVSEQYYMHVDPGVEVPGLRKTTKKLCAAPNVRLISVCPSAFLNSGRSRISPVTGSHNSGCLRVTLKTQRTSPPTR